MVLKIRIVSKLDSFFRKDIFMLKLKRGEEMIYNYIDLRREFHKYPELSWMEYKTTERIADILNKLNIRRI